MGYIYVFRTVRSRCMSTGVGPQRGTGESTVGSLATDAGSAGDAGLSRERLYDVLANQRRRFALHYLKGRDRPTPIGELSEQVAAWENGCSVTEIDSAERKRVYTALQQSHLPVMDDAGVVAFDKDRGIVEPAPVLADVDIYFDLVQGRDIPWSEYYLALAAVGAGLTAAAWAGIPPLTVLPEFGVAVFMVVALAVSAVAHLYQMRSQRIGGEGPPPEVERADRE